MGLDMYLFKKKNGDRERPELAYWRKANQVHAWFVKNVQGGVDDCGDYPVTVDQLKELLNVCEQVKSKISLKDGKIRNTAVAEELLPTEGGFFFGSTDYDQYYLDDIKDTVDQVSAVIKKMQADPTMEVIYHSSW
jgi:hypothetical protein